MNAHGRPYDRCPICGGPAGGALAKNLELGWSPCRGCGGPPAVIATLRAGEEHPLHPGWFLRSASMFDHKLIREGYPEVEIGLFELISEPYKADEWVATLIRIAEDAQAWAERPTA